MSRRWFASEVVQTSVTDCGPAALKCLLSGFAIDASYASLREACQTGVDGTSIDTLEDVGKQLGLPLEQVILPVDYACMPEAGAFPAVLVTKLPGGATHFVVLWRRLGRFVQLMDPASGRRWVRVDALAKQLYTHTLALSESSFTHWAASEDCCGPLRRRLRELGLSRSQLEREMQRALGDESWLGSAVLDAAARMITTLVAGGALRKGREAACALSRLCEVTRADPSRIPPRYWTVRARQSEASSTVNADAEPAEVELGFAGALMLRVVRGGSAITTESDADAGGRDEVERIEPPRVATGLHSALSAAPAQSLGVTLRFLRRERGLPLVLLSLTLLVAAAAPLLEAAALRATTYVRDHLQPGAARLVGMGAIVALLALCAGLEWPLGAAIARMGRLLEVRLRLAYLAKLPRLGARYFRTRLLSDMAERAHALYNVRKLPELAARALRSALGLVLTTGAVAFLDGRAGVILAAMVGVSIGVPLLFQPAFLERDLRKRTYEGALMRFYLDALMGVVPVRSHNAQPAIRGEHEALLVEWTRAGLSRLRYTIVVEGIVAFAAVLGSCGALWSYLGRHSQPAEVLLVAFLVLQMQAMVTELVAIARQIPLARNTTLRMQELLAAPDEYASAQEQAEQRAQAPRADCGVALRFEQVRVGIGDRALLHPLTTSIAAGEHVAIVGASGAGKSTLVGLLLGWQHATGGHVLVDGAPLHGAALVQLRAQTAWIDPGVQLWNDTLLANLGYGASEDFAASMARVVDAAALEAVLHKLPAGLQTPLGENGARLSGGEGQRVRLGRALQLQNPRLVIMDEAFRGLDRDQRARLQRRVRDAFAGATLLCITHDARQSLDFDRILVLDQGRLIEAAPPAVLNADPNSHYRAMLEQQRALEQQLWSDVRWRRVQLSEGRLHEREARGHE